MATPAQQKKQREAERGGPEMGFDIPEGDGPLLTDKGVVEAMVRQFLTDVLDVRKAYNGGSVKGEDASVKINDIAKRYAAIFMGNDAAYSFTDWNSPEQLGVFLAGQMGEGVKPDDAAEAFFLRLSADFIADAVVPFEDDQIDMETAAFRMDAAVEDATFSLLGLQNPATEND